MACSTPSCVSWISTPWRFANAKGSWRTDWAPAAATAAAAVLALSGLAAIEHRRIDRVRRDRGWGDGAFFDWDLRQWRQDRVLLVAHESYRIGRDLALLVLNVLIAAARLKARVVAVAQDSGPDENHEIGLRVLRSACAEQP